LNLLDSGGGVASIVGTFRIQFSGHCENSREAR
jgi:hypothetical protein